MSADDIGGVPMAAAVQVEGAKELAALLRKIADKDLQKANRLALRKGAEVVAVEARSNAPSRSGRLRSRTKAYATQRSASVQAKVPYAMAIHWGRKTGNVGSPPGNHPGRNVIVGRPFIWNAAQAKTEQVAEVYRIEVMDVVKQIDGRL
jgi:HK97 gp10 family phage protein